ncbi:hypothetical protein CRG98_019855 [Punica granatum]|uniref:Uncharacterized protein n=1 Tax=Punica granatum TaxID=22663 RepID=A0A2I0JU19_PUNGR|nr:hypothetical protein CRG98_019855 [Punica granatum]
MALSRAEWMPPGPMALKCSDFNGVPLVSHVGSTTYFPARVVRQLGGLQMMPEDTARTKFEHTWREDQTSVNRLSEIERVMTVWQTMVIKNPYFPEHPTQENRDFQATEEYVVRFYRWGSSIPEDPIDSAPDRDSSSSVTPRSSDSVILASGLRETAFAVRWSRKTNSSSISTSFRGNSPRPMLK